MSKEKNLEVVEQEKNDVSKNVEPKEQSTKVENKDLPQVNDSIDWEALENPGLKKQSLDYEYLELVEGESIRAVYTGTFIQEIKGKEMACATFISKNGAKLSASHMIVQACSKLNNGDALEIIYKGVQKLGNGNNLGLYEIYKLTS